MSTILTIFYDHKKGRHGGTVVSEFPLISKMIILVSSVTQRH